MRKSKTDRAIDKFNKAYPQHREAARLKLAKLYPAGSYGKSEIVMASGLPWVNVPMAHDVEHINASLQEETDQIEREKEQHEAIAYPFILREANHISYKPCYLTGQMMEQLMNSNPNG